MPRPPRDLQPGSGAHLTTQGNHRECCLTRRACRDVLLDTLAKVQQKYGFKLYALCIMSNHVHDLLEPAESSALPSLMHGLH